MAAREPAMYAEVAAADPESSADAENDSNSGSDKEQTARGRIFRSIDRPMVLAVLAGVVIVICLTRVLQAHLGGGASDGVKAPSGHTYMGTSGSGASVEASILVWTYAGANGTCRGAANGFMKIHGKQANYVNVVEDARAADPLTPRCIIVAELPERAPVHGVCDSRAAKLGVVRCSTYGAPRTPAGRTLDVRFPGKRRMDSSERQGDVLSVSFHSADDEQMEERFLEQSEALLQKRRDQAENLYVNVLQGVGDTDPEEFLWLEEWATTAAGARDGREARRSLEGNMEDYLEGPLVVFNPTGDGDMLPDDKAGTWEHIGGLR
eukprot:TRINITY_DN5605_c0_g1_i1.p1 TRINITY_DN5605_c0_g1~~TRINITY_DN5605_c0_g1_i1.p1  ORF type:complete len:322 (-),score=87.97 TRINITY_DN5605_c0_g1_i1:70-1035(-)